MLLMSCTGDSYQNAIPRGCTALMSVDVSQAYNASGNGEADPQNPAAGATDNGSGSMLNKVFGLENLAESGIDLASRIYLFESADGHFGLVASVKKEKALRQWTETMQQKGTAHALPDRHGKHFCLLNDAWLMAYDADKTLVMGPVVASAQAALALQMARYMEQDERQGMAGTPMMARLDDLSAPMALVAQTVALPQSLAAVFALGAPKDADASQVMIAAGMEVDDGTLVVRGETFSFNKSIDSHIKASQQAFRPMKGQFLRRLPQASLCWMTNSEGGQFYEMLQQNKALKGLLTGANVSFDFRQVVGDISGDLTVVVDSVASASPRIMMLAQKADGSEYFAATDKSMKAETAFAEGTSALTTSQQSLLKGARSGLVVQLSQIGNREVTELAQSLMSPLFGDITTIVYVMK